MTFALIAAAALAVVGVQIVVAALPATPDRRADGVIGFALGLAPMAWLLWTICSRPLGFKVVALMLGASVVVVLILARAGHLTWAAPFQVAAAASVGVLLARQVIDAWWLAVFAGVGIVADAWSVFAGPTRAVVQHAPRVLDYVLVHFAPVGGPAGGMGLGMSDLVFLSLFTAGGLLLGLKSRAGFAAMLGSLVLTVLLAVIWKPAVPALPLLSMAFLLANTGIWIRMVREYREARLGGG